ncbi:MAG: TIGR03667 family PPOX class F420-dependent oxidoreductase [Chloroflexi bacterium]|nr:MAG: TIGR03667 family PPOX class F420-dependent oxidoreductase [Chloroflexota bacterium]
MVEINQRLERLLHDEKIAWLTTVRADGMPQPTPIWFWWDGATFLIWSQPQAQKLRNIAQNPKVALNFNTDPTGEVFAVFMGEAHVDPNPAPPADRAAFLAKYADDIQMIGFTVERLNAEFSTLIRMAPVRVRAQLEAPHEVSPQG